MVGGELSVIEYLPRNLQQSGLHLTQYGIEDCVPGHFFGPAVRDYYLLHYVLAGEGIFEVGATTYQLGKGDGFIIYPGIVTYYQADTNKPWSYCWVGFNGTESEMLLKRAGITRTSPTFYSHQGDLIDRCLQAMIESKALHKGRDLHLTGLLYLLLSVLVESNQATILEGKEESRKEYYVSKAIDFIEMNYAMKITVEDIAKFLGLNRSYACSLFKQRMNVSLQEYLIRYRVHKACELMENVELTISDIARSVGYADPLLFSKMFKKILGVSPKPFRMQLIK